MGLARESEQNVSPFVLVGQGRWRLGEIAFSSSLLEGGPCLGYDESNVQYFGGCGTRLLTLVQWLLCSTGAPHFFHVLCSVASASCRSCFFSFRAV